MFVANILALVFLSYLFGYILLGKLFISFANFCMLKFFLGLLYDVYL